MIINKTFLSVKVDPNRNLNYIKEIATRQYKAVWNIRGAVLFLGVPKKGTFFSELL